MLNYSSMQTVGGFEFKVLEDNSGASGYSTLSVKGPSGWTVALIDSRGKCNENSQYSLVPRRDITVRYYNVYRAAGGGFVLGKRAFASDQERRRARDSSRALFGMKMCVDVVSGVFISGEQV